ncbi:MAG: alpha-amylase family glycosyl hydrolase [Lachnospiraceae bacterium]|nr:alpha-amylase family glycosyl hydrolase [Lachnospiraceae bacterium]
MDFVMREGDYLRMGVFQASDGVTFTFEGEKEQKCEILLYEKDTSQIEAVEVPREYCVGSLRSIVLSGLDTSRYDYNYRIDGQVMVDPYARRIVGRERWFEVERYSKTYQVRGGFACGDFDWGEDEPPEIDKKDMIMYQLHVRNFTMDATGMAGCKGTFEGVERKLPYLKELGITTVVFLPVYEFEELILPVEEDLPDYITWKEEQRTKKKAELKVEKVNCWGYVEGNYFAVKTSYAKGKSPEQSFKHLVKSMHAQNMECIMQIYFPDTVNQNLMLDAMRYWVMEYHVDGFHLMGSRIPVRAMAQDVILSRTKLFYDRFDEDLLAKKCAYPHLYILRDEFMYPMRRLLNHQGGNLVDFVNQMRKQKAYAGFVNYMDSINGFSLADVFSYNEKHNEQNGEDNADGNDWNYSSNYGMEGPTRKKYIEQVRLKQMRNALAILFLGQSVPMLMEGDEFANSQKGNNNAYCQDNKIGWVNWNNEKKYASLQEFVKKMIAFRREHAMIHLNQPMQLHDYKGYGYPDLSYHGDSAWVTGFEQNRQSVGLLYCGKYAEEEGQENGELLYIAYNFHTGKQFLALPKLKKKKTWKKIMDTQLEQGFLEHPQEMTADRAEISGMTIQILIGKQG